jgi:hypothetical protein
MPETSLQSNVRLSQDVLFQELEGEAVLLNLKTGVYFGLDTTGTRMWQLMSENAVLSDVLCSLLKEYDVSQDRCAADLLSLVAKLGEHGLLSIE